MAFFSLLRLRIRSSPRNSSASSLEPSQQLSAHNLHLHDANQPSQDSHNTDNMPQEQGYPVLSSVSYQRPVTPHQNNSSNTQQPNALITPPDTLRHSASHESFEVGSVSMTVTSDVSLSASDIRSMAHELSEARQSNEIPRTSSSPLDAQVTVEDYGFLIRLREQRGNHSTPVTDAYKQLLVEFARRIKERDFVLDEKAVKAEAARRVSNYISNLEHERFVYDTATSSPSSPPASVNGSLSSRIDAETFSEEVLSIIEQVADQTLLDATEPLRHHEKVMKILEKCLREDSFDLKSRIKSLNSTGSLYDALLKKYETQQQRQNIAFQLHEASLRDVSGHLRNVSDTLSDCGSFYSTQNGRLQIHTETFSQRLMVHNQLLDNQQDLNTHLLDQYRGVVSSLQTLMQSQGQSTVVSAHNLSTVASIVNQLSSITMNLPRVMDQSVQQSVSDHVQCSMQRIMHAQQQAMLSLSEAQERQNAIDYDILATKVVDKIQTLRNDKAKNKKHSRVCRIVKKLFCL